jgi:hypothetical protein
MTTFRESIAETLSTVSKAKARSATLWERVERVESIIIYWIILELIKIKDKINIMLRLFILRKENK